MTPARRFLSLGLALLSALLTAAHGTGAGTVDLYGIEGPHNLGEGYYLGHVGGKVRYGKEGAGRRDWEIVPTDRGALIRVSSGEADPYNRWYLGYDATGKDPTVILTREPGDGSYWAIGKVTAADAGPHDRTLHARGGPLSGWFLSVGEPADKRVDQDGREFRMVAAVLTASPKVIPRFYLFEIAP
jgi:hypothetical protein